jgi:hypothetical protein
MDEHLCNNAPSQGWCFSFFKVTLKLHSNRVGTAILCDYDLQLQELLARVREAASLVLRVLAVWEVVRRLAIRLMEESLTVRAQQRELWPAAGVVGSGCGAKASSRERCIRCLG